jgi:hypothetical protein
MAWSLQTRNLSPIESDVMFKKIARSIGSLTVGRKLAFIYFLDLTAVIFISGSALQQGQTRFLILEGRLDAIVKGIDSGYREAYQASSPALRSSLLGTQERMRKSVDDFRASSRVLAGLNSGTAGAEETTCAGWTGT